MDRVKGGMKEEGGKCFDESKDASQHPPYLGYLTSFFLCCVQSTDVELLCRSTVSRVDGAQKRRKDHLFIE